MNSPDVSERASRARLASIAKLLEQQIKAHSDGKLATYAPHSGQLDFHKSNHKIRLIVCGNRWGKTECSVVEALQLCLGTHPYHPRKLPVKGKIYAETYGHISQYIEPKILKWVGERHLDPKKPFTRTQQGHLSGVRFANGSLISIGVYAQSDSVSEGSDWDFVAFDEPPSRDLYVANLRGLADRNGIMWFAMTPLSEAWIYDDLWLPGLNGTKPYVYCKNGNSYENPYTDREGLDLYSSEMNETERAIRIRGEFKRLEGLVIDTYDAQLSMVDPIIIDNKFTIYEGIDPHLAKPHTAIWKAVHESGYRYVIQELYYAGGMQEFGELIAQKRRELREHGAEVVRSVADTSLNQTDGNFRIRLRDELISGLSSQGETLFPVNAQKRDYVAPGIQRLKDLYRSSEHIVHPPHSNTIDLFCPTQYVFKNCTKYAHELTHWQWKYDIVKENPLAQDFGNDGLDCDRYIESIAPTFQTKGMAMVKREYANRHAYKTINRYGKY